MLVRLTRDAPLSVSRAWRLQVGQVSIGGSRYTKPQRFSIAQLVPGFWRLKWRRTRFFLTLVGPELDSPRDAPAWGSEEA